ncbi:hypothetical protein ACLOJK_033471, partial [Asimina triloba]
MFCFACSTSSAASTSATSYSTNATPGCCLWIPSSPTKCRICTWKALLLAWSKLPLIKGQEVESNISKAEHLIGYLTSLGLSPLSPSILPIILSLLEPLSLSFLPIILPLLDSVALLLNQRRLLSLAAFSCPVLPIVSFPLPLSLRTKMESLIYFFSISSLNRNLRSCPPMKLAMVKKKIIARPLQSPH